MPHPEMKWAATMADAKMLSSAGTGTAPTDVEAPTCPNSPTPKSESPVRPGGSR